MLSFSEVKRYINDNPAVTKFKPWWEIAIDYLLIGLFLITFISWTKTYSIEVGGLICVPLYGDAYSVATSDIRYIQSRCFIESPVSKVNFYPYLILLQWGVMFLCQISWVWIPTVTAKFNYFYNIFNEIMQVELQFSYNPNSYGMLPDINYSKENKAKLRIINDRITFILMDKNYLTQIYRRKSYILTALIVISIIVLIFWISITNFLEANFSCNLQQGYAKKQSDEMVCTITPQLYIYGFMLLHMMILLLMLSLSTKSVIWHRYMSYRVRDATDKFFGLFSDNYKGLPGYDDLALILELFKRNQHDGMFSVTTLLYVLTKKYDPDVYKSDQEKRFENEENKLYRFSFWEELCIATYMAAELGLEIKNFEQTPDSLFKYLEVLYKRLYDLGLGFETDIKIKIRDEIIKNLSYYTHLAERNIAIEDKSVGKAVPTRYSVTEKIDNVLLKQEWPDHLILLAAVNLMRIKVILITAHPPIKDDIFTSNVFKPFDTEHTHATIIMIFVNPNYYYALEKCSGSDPSQSAKRADFLTKGRYRDRLRGNAIRKVGDAISSQITKTKTRKIEYQHLEDPIPRKTLQNTDDVCNLQNDDDAFPIDTIERPKIFKFLSTPKRRRKCFLNE
ncbi:hypothetical protein RF11_11523 [Thelohanellus kitauei]|uniref:LRRC8 pannexin-like TM region domain-containing protein n=1 Tax=Thelohanellus kitauei TaxID=669202 RepID=A0A0C2NBR2_THEKT|nr:hypothetical protein RF11_11523 [Thelohanellus kitauei]